MAVRMAGLRLVGQLHPWAIKTHGVERVQVGRHEAFAGKTGRQVSGGRHLAGPLAQPDLAW